MWNKKQLIVTSILKNWFVSLTQFSVLFFLFNVEELIQRWTEKKKRRSSEWGVDYLVVIVTRLCAVHAWHGCVVL